MDRWKHTPKPQVEHSYRERQFSVTPQVLRATGLRSLPIAIMGSNLAAATRPKEIGSSAQTFTLTGQKALL
jgi:hypothetical protein